MTAAASLSRERGTLRSGERDLDGHRQPRHRTRCHTATLLPNGKVLVAGGYDSDGALASAELYDPASGTWTATGSLATARVRHTATLLPNGKVLVAGGVDSSGYSRERGTLRSGERDLDGHRQPRHRTLLITRRRCCPTARCSSQADHGNVGVLASAELYDPASGTWTATGSLTTARYGHTATLLPNGKVLVAGGYNGLGYLASAELYDPASGTWTATGSLATARYDHTATLLPNGKVLVAGGDMATSRHFSRARNST